MFVNLDVYRKRLEQLKVCCRRRGTGEVPLDFERDLYGFIAAEIAVNVLGMFGKDVQLGFLSEILKIPDKVKRKDPGKIAAYVMFRWFQCGNRLVREFARVMREVQSDDPEEAAKETLSKGMPPHVLWALAKHLGRDDFAASLPGQPFFTEEEMEFYRLRYETAAYLYALRKLEGDRLESAIRREIEEKTFSYRQEIERLRGKLARAPDVIAEKVIETENYKKLYEKAKADLEEAQSLFAKESRELKEELGRLKREVGVLRSALARYEKQHLSGLTVCIVGDESHREGYEEIILEYGGRMDFVSGIEDVSIVRQAVRSADAVVVVGAYCKHKVFIPAKEEAQRLNVPLAVCPSAGLGAFRETVEKLRERLEKAG